MPPSLMVSDPVNPPSPSLISNPVPAIGPIVKSVPLNPSAYAPLKLAFEKVAPREEVFFFCAALSREAESRTTPSKQIVFIADPLCQDVWVVRAARILYLSGSYGYRSVNVWQTLTDRAALDRDGCL